ncbi:annexin A5 [Protopterus annectens]|uniref:annexin A5 n=1 Tax=Protopterus annectens TaxID=7888 RepID=UPI001CFBD771|nr:annexin A5 [Protopterus annectens]
MASQGKGYRGYVKDFVHFDAKKDADMLRKAMKGLGTDEDTVVKILACRSNAQRQDISAAFKKAYGRDLVDDLKSELTGKLENLMVALMKTPVCYDAHELRNAIKGAGTSENVLIEILASRTKDEIENIKKTYKKEFSTDLESAIMGDTSGHFQRMLVVLLQAARDQNPRADENLVEKDARALFDAGEKKWGTDEDLFINILGNRSVAHLRRVFDAYMKIAGFHIEESIERETTGHMEKVLLAVVKCVRNVPAYFAECLYKAMKGGGTDDATLTRIVVSRCEVDMLDIREEFRKNHGQSLYNMIQNDTSGDYRTALLLLCGGKED